ncbi:MAG: hypothetical protein NT141_00250 [candidate division WWE3 bacterium]|nr:hypothetical protein [candidate division WWE3 bacterium]
MLSDPHYLKAANKLKDERHLEIQVVSIIEEAGGDLIVYLKQVKENKNDTKSGLKSFKDDLEATLGRHLTLQIIGSREVAALLGGVGRCDRELCCHQWLPSPQNPSAQTLVEQNIDGIPSAYLGMCGKLLCCLIYETDNFKLDCAYGTKIREQLTHESVEVQRKVEEARGQAEVTKPKIEEKKQKRVVHRVLKR